MRGASHADTVGTVNLCPHGSNVTEQSFIAGRDFSLALLQQTFQLNTVTYNTLRHQTPHRCFTVYIRYLFITAGLPDVGVSSAGTQPIATGRLGQLSP